MIFKDKVILVTGASSGIGAGAARHLAKLGGKVALVGRNEKRLNAVTNRIVSDGSPVPLAIVADVTVDAERIINETIEYFGKLDVLINNAGISVGGEPFFETDIAVFDSVMNTNVRSIVLLTQLAVPHLEKTKGNIVNICSIAALAVVPNATFYNISKATLEQLTKCCAFEFGSRGIRVNSINPSVIKTTVFEQLATHNEQFKQHEAELCNTFPLRRIGEVSDVSAAIAYLASDSASFVTGANILVDGGALRAAVF